MHSTTLAATLRPVVVTGLGLVTPLGTSVQSTWNRLIAGESGITSTSFLNDTALAALPCTVAGQVLGPWPPADAPKFMHAGDRTRTSRFIQMALLAAAQAMADAQWHPQSDRDRAATGVAVGCGIGGVDEFAAIHTLLNDPESGLRRVSPFAVPRALVNMAAGHVSLYHGLHGPNLCPATACAAGANAIADAARAIALGDADVMVAGASESTINCVSMAGFARAKALASDSNHDPSRASRPFSRSRAGFVMAEGSGMLVLESLDHALARGAPRIYATVSGTGFSSDAHHITAPPPDGAGAARAMTAALRGFDRSRVGYLNAHATSTGAGDAAELQAIRSVFSSGTLPSVSSTKGALGHLLGAAGAVEAAIAILAMHHNILPPTINLDDPAPEAEGFDLVPNVARQPDRPLEAVMSNSFGFGGTNVSLLFTRPPSPTSKK